MRVAFMRAGLLIAWLAGTVALAGGETGPAPAPTPGEKPRAIARSHAFSAQEGHDTDLVCTRLITADALFQVVPGEQGKNGDRAIKFWRPKYPREVCDYDDPTNKIFTAKGTISPCFNVMGTVFGPITPQNPQGIYPGIVTHQCTSDPDPWTIQFRLDYAKGYDLRVETVDAAQEDANDIPFDLQQGGDPVVPRTVPADAMSKKPKGPKCKIEIQSPPVAGATFDLYKVTEIVAVGTTKEKTDADQVHVVSARPVYGMLFDPKAAKLGMIRPIIGKVIQQSPNWKIRFDEFPVTGTEWTLRVRSMHGRGVADAKIKVTR
jgi:hypothetical protein